MPEPRYETAHLRIGTEFDEPLCAGNLEHLERVVTTLEQRLDTRLATPLEVYLWDPRDSKAEDWCPHDYNLGCFEDGSVRSDPLTVDHEIVHAVVATIGNPAPFWSEGAAEALQSSRTLFSASVPVDNLDLDTPQLSYAIAGHFSRWLFEAYGAESYRQLLRQKGDARRAFEETYGFAFETAQAQFYEEAPYSYGALIGCEHPELVQSSDQTWSEALEIDCANSDVHSTPFGMSTFRVLNISTRGYYEFSTSAEIGTIARCDDETLESPVTDMQDWGDVPPVTDAFIYQYARAFEGVGAATVYDLAPGRYEIAVGTSVFEASSATLDVHAVEGGP